jgi:hypothetical protein
MTYSIRATRARRRHEYATKMTDFRASMSDLNFGNQKFTIELTMNWPTSRGLEISTGKTDERTTLFVDDIRVVRSPRKASLSAQLRWLFPKYPCRVGPRPNAPVPFRTEHRLNFY